jgi:alpha-L-rhamnosidase
MLVFFLFMSVCRAQVSVSGLRCEGLTNPVGIDRTEPLLSWELESSDRGVEQTAYRIIVSSSRELLEKDTGDLWDSGKLNQTGFARIRYTGSRLKINSRCFWKVKVWTTKGESGWSEPAFWQVGLLQQQDWAGRWIGFARHFPWDGNPWESRLSARYFTKEFTLHKEIKSATAYIFGLGLYELFMNGERTGDQVLAPIASDYTKNVLYNAFDVSEQLKPGRNAIGIILGNGRYFTMRQFIQPYKIKHFGYPKVLFNLIITYTDGTTETIATDDTWKGTADGPVRANNEYDGEEYDATREMPGWAEPGFYDGNWMNAEFVQEPGGNYEAQMTEPMKVRQTISPVSVTGKGNGRYILDFGQNLTGWVWFKVRGERGNQVRLRYAESLRENGELFTDNLRDAKAEAWYTLKGNGEESHEPSFTYYGFRFVEVSNYPGSLKAEDFVAKMVYDDFQTVGSFETSNTLLNRIYQNAWWGIAGNYKGMPVDCPQRNERQPWLGDRSIGSYGESFMFDHALLYEKLLDDIRYAQRADGSLPDVAPAFWRYYSDNMTWAGTYLMVADMLYCQFGNSGVISRHYPAMKLWLNYMQDRYMNENFIMTKDSYGDWCPPPVTIEEGKGKSANIKYPSMLISTAYHYYYLQLMQKFARLADHETDISAYAAMSEKVRNAFQQEFFHAENFSYGENTLTDNLLPLAFGMVPHEYHKKVFQTVTDIIEIRNKGHLSTGLIGTQWLMRTLTENGRADLAYRIATNKTYPSWGYMIEKGATTIWELWNGDTAAPDMNSQNHVMMLGDLIVWYYEYLAGIKADPEEVAFRRILMNPCFIRDLDYVKASFHSCQGPVASYWKRTNNRMEWQITIPPNTRAEVHIPAKAVSQIEESERKLQKEQPCIRYLKTENDRQVFEIQSGSYIFKF